MQITRAGTLFGHHQRSTRLALAALAGLAGGVCAVQQAAFAQPGGPSIPLTAAAQASGAQISYSQGIEFVTIGAAGNAVVPATFPQGYARGRGSVSYEYRIGRMEVTTSQWVEFFNAAFDRPSNDRLPHLIPPGVWGAQGATPTVPDGRRWTVPAGNENRLVGNISWRMAAMYCNWLCNDKGTDRAAFLNGAYDVATFGGLSPNGFSDQVEHSPGAQYWIPTFDEWVKAAHFDPNRLGDAAGGWWRFPTLSDVVPVYGPPGQGQANAGAVQIPSQQLFHPLGSYPTVQSPWGLLDTAGGTSEWLESALAITGPNLDIRLQEGSSFALSFGSSRGSDLIEGTSGSYPSISEWDFGFRIASAVPTPGVSALLGLGIALALRRRRT